MPNLSSQDAPCLAGEANLIRPVLRAVAPSLALFPTSPKTPVITAKSENVHPILLAVEPAILIVSNNPSTVVLACACAFANISA